MGRTSINTSTEAQQQGNYSDVDKLHLELYLPPEQFDYIASAISTSGPDRLKLSATVEISAFRSEVDKSLSEPIASVPNGTNDIEIHVVANQARRQALLIAKFEHASDPLPPYSRVKIDSPGADGIDR